SERLHARGLRVLGARRGLRREPALLPARGRGLGRGEPAGPGGVPPDRAGPHPVRRRAAPRQGVEARQHLLRLWRSRRSPSVAIAPPPHIPSLRHPVHGLPASFFVLCSSFFAVRSSFFVLRSLLFVLRFSG